VKSHRDFRRLPRALEQRLPCKDQTFNDDVTTCAKTVGARTPVLLVGETGTGKTVLCEVLEEYLVRAVPDAVSYFAECLDTQQTHSDAIEAVDNATRELRDYLQCFYASIAADEIVQISRDHARSAAVKGVDSEGVTRAILEDPRVARIVAGTAFDFKSPRKGLRYDCGWATSEDKTRSELFGYVKGAFTGANQDHAGLFALAAEGQIVFLDNVQLLQKGVQALLLGVTDRRRPEFAPVGAANKIIRFRGTLVAAAKPVLEEQVAKQEFHEDLYYRLRSAVLHMPSLSVHLRQHKDDPGAFCRGKLDELDDRVKQQLLARDYRGNIRDFENLVDDLSRYPPEEQIAQLQKLTPVQGSELSGMEDLLLTPSLKEARKKFDERYLQRLVDKNPGLSYEKTADLAGIDADTVRKILGPRRAKRNDE
jgi:DNA-binding NtrC family response regulator